MGGAILIALLSFSLVACNLDGDADVSSDDGSSEENATSTDVGESGLVDDTSDDSSSSDSTSTLDYTYDESTNTYTVYTANGLLAWNEAAQGDLTLNCTLTADIDMTGIEWTPVGNSSSQYVGAFDGGGHTIKGLTVNETGIEYVGLIGNLGSGGVVQNLILDNVSITGSSDVGAVVGYSWGGTITACYYSNADAGVGGGTTSEDKVDVTKVDGDWSAAVEGMNEAIDTWNESNDNQCEWKYELTGELPTLTKDS